MNTYNNNTKLCDLAYKYGSDKCPKLGHSYTPFYYELFDNRRRSVKKLLEIGIGPYKSRPRKYRTRGASLFMWRDFFPQAQIYGADIDQGAIFEDDRIKTYLIDERKKDDLVKLILEIGTDIDLVIDDASHDFMDQLNTCRILMPYLPEDCVYIIEDIAFSRKLISILKEYHVIVPEITNRNANNQLALIKHKKE